jgi:tetratricopeptide (TPR) repeat protein
LTGKVKKTAVAHAFLFAVALSCLPVPAAGAQAADGEEGARSGADSFLREAQAAYTAGSLPLSRRLLDSALQLSPDYSECLYLRARLELADRATTRAAIEDLRAALRGGSWNETDPDAARHDLADVLITTGALPEALGLLGGLAARHPENQDVPLMLGRLYRRSGDLARAGQVLADAVARFPLDDDLRLLYVDVLRRRGSPGPARDVIATGLNLHPVSLPLMLAAAQGAPTAAARRAAVDRYTGAGGGDPLSAVVALESGAGSASKYLDLFTAQGGLVREDLVERALAAVRGNGPLVKRLTAALAAYSGSRDLDPDGLGWTERWTFRDGAVTGWTRDSNRDGAPPFSAQFVGGTPGSLAYRLPSGTVVTIRYSRYPFIDWTEPRPGVRLFSVPYTQQCVFLLSPRPGAPAGLAPLAAAAITPPSAAQLDAGAYRREETLAGGAAPVRVTELTRGRAVFGEEDTNGDGIMDRRTWYRDGLPARSARAPIPNGPFTVTETWKSGRLAGADFDEDRDGIVEYRELYGPRPMKMWDYNGDGRMDVREYPGPGAGVVRELSTAGNGFFDVRVTWNGPRVVRVERNGVPLSVIADARRGVSWIGPPAPPGAVVDPAQPDGYVRIADREYLVFHYAGVMYAEGVK